VAAVGAAVLSLAGCGDDSGSSSRSSAPTFSGPTPTTPPASEEKLPEELRGGFNPTAVYGRAAPGVVTVLSIFTAGSQGEAGQGSGFVLDRQGEIVTNAHVVTTGRGASIRRAQQVYVEFPDRNQVRARIVGVDPFADVALIRIDPDGLDLSPIPLASGRGLRPGQPVAAIGSPFGQEESLSVGVISATGRSVESLTSFQIDDAIQTDAAINHGNSGGPLRNAAGHVIGINQQIESSSGGGEGVGFAVPVTAIRRSVDALRRNGRVRYAYIGVTTEELYPQLAKRLGISSDAGALVADIVNGGPADRAGLRGGSRRLRFQGRPVVAGGDVILAVNGKKLLEANDLSRIVFARRPGETVTLQILRGRDRRDVKVRLGVRPARVARG
jgi:S1-C subfamily serine protease